MTRRIISVALIVLGALAIALAIASATVWRPTDTVTLTLPERPSTAVVVSDAGVLDAVGSEVTVEATADDGQPVTLAVGRTADVDAWVRDAPHTRITGLASWQELTVEPAGEEADTAEAGVPDPAGSDLWVAEQSGTGSAELSWEDREGRWSLVAATDGTAPAPQVSLTWPVEVRTPWLVPGLVVGAVLLLAGLTLLAVDLLARRELRRRQEATAVERVTETPTATGLSRRQLRERSRDTGRDRRGTTTGEIPVATGATAARAGETDAAGPGVAAAGQARGAGIVPASPRAEELRRGREEPAHVPAAGAAGDATQQTAAVGDDSTQQTRAVDTTEQIPAVDTTGDATQQMPAVGGEDARQAAGVAKGAGVVPAPSRPADAPGGTDDEAWTEAPGETGETGEDAEGGAAPSWRSVWGFTDRNRKQDESEENR
ncbi:hypothetical protein [Georgenia sp. AZ-5]|uniref:hypothetical protein n=1 Tax=Georgenia sp. AZ-5 TaxID=3367526 RepID=UPI0037551CA3